MESLRSLFTSFNDMMNSNLENTGMVKVGLLFHKANIHAVAQILSQKYLLVHEVNSVQCDLLWMACSVIRAANFFFNQMYL